MESRAEAREFLKSRRAKLSPPSSVPPSDPTSRAVHRRVPGLRREEVAALAGVSVDYYTRLEKGRLETASPAVLDAIARALQLDSAERSHLYSLARASRGELAEPPPDATDGALRPQLRWLLDAMGRSPAYVRNGRLDVLAHNVMGHALYKPMFDSMGDRPNLALFCFLDGRAQEFFPKWPEVAEETVALLRAETGRHPSDAVTADLVQSLLHGSTAFFTLWATHDVRRILAEGKEFAHPQVGPLTLTLEALEVCADPGLTVVAYAAQPASQSEEGLNRLSQTRTATPSG
ncbi:helix-turn-helix transcriptional regulator [Pedococcus sp. 5OH_020]|uniref:helix-turn-helix transcriptional regulator n=1 Tax=Pedococcus sp. 5OH_020 TaxID=2989814 RepID=UPI0022E9C332|nr:helix-turn-helix transcriptional regulator [Pedococcus sp. 5OH_020]